MRKLSRLANLKIGGLPFSPRGQNLHKKQQQDDNFLLERWSCFAHVTVDNQVAYTLHASSCSPLDAMPLTIRLTISLVMASPQYVSGWVCILHDFLIGFPQMTPVLERILFEFKNSLGVWRAWKISLLRLIGHPDRELLDLQERNNGCCPSGSLSNA